MRHIVSLFIAASSLLLTANSPAATRPRYGGTLHVTMRAAPPSLDPASLGSASLGSAGLGSADWLGARDLSRLMFDTLVTLDNSGRPQPALAAAWQSEPSSQRWQFSIRRGVTFADGTALTSDTIAASLRAANPSWKVRSESESVVIERESAAPDLPAELALPRNSIVRRDGARISGTGPFAATQWDAGKKLVLSAREDYWGGRAFLDSIEIELGKSFRDQSIALDVGKAQLIEVAPEQLHRASAENNRVEHSEPVELMALLFSRDLRSEVELHCREALALVIDRTALNTVVLQSGGEPSAALLPNWMTGYAFVFPTKVDLADVRQNLIGFRQTAPWTLGYDPSDPSARVLAERIALNAHDAGLSLQPTAGAADLRLVRVPLVSLNAHVALAEVAKSLGILPPRPSASVLGDLYAAENELLRSQRVIPLLHLRTAAGVQSTVRNWHASHDESWDLPNVWLAPGADKP
jgi:peptide/nickel transport system substrate-binding protein